MHDEQASREAALAELRRTLADGLARTRLTKTQVKARANLGRTTVHQAFQADGPVPAAATVVALARVLRLPEQAVLDLRRAAVGESRTASAKERGPGKPIDEWDPHILEVHPAGPALGADAECGRALPGYVARAHDAILAAAVQDAAEGRSRLVVLVGSSSTGKTRACWEAVQPLARQGWRLWHPFDPTRADAALDDLARVQPLTVIWLNEAQHYLGDPGVGERVAAAVHSLLTSSERSPVLVLGTLWPEYANQYTALPSPNAPDPHSRVRELLAGRTVAVPDTFDQEALRRAAALADAGDWLLGATLRRASTDRRVTQDLAGAPELLRRYEQGTPAARAVLEAAMDARRLGVGLHLPQSFLIDAAFEYLSEHDGDRLAEDWAERVLAELALPVHGHQAPLRLTRVRPLRPSARPHQHSPAVGAVFRLADFLEQHGRGVRRALCPPASFWHAARDHLTDPAALSTLSGAAELRYRLEWAHSLRLRAGDAGDQRTLAALAQARAAAGDRYAAEAHLRRAADTGSVEALTELARMREEAGDREEAANLYRRVADAVEPGRLYFRARAEEPDSTIGAEILYRRAADLGELIALRALAPLREGAGDREGAEAIYRQGADANDPDSMIILAWMRAEAGDRDDAEILYSRAVGIGGVRALVSLARAREVSGDTKQAQALYARAVGADSTEALVALARMRTEAGDRDSAEILYSRAANRGDAHAWLALAQIREEAGDRDAAEHCCRRAADAANAAGGYVTLMTLAQMREETGDRGSTTTLIRQAADAAVAADVTAMLVDWARRRVAAGDRESAEALVSRAADAGSADALVALVELREDRGDRHGSQGLADRAADTGNTRGLNVLARLREEAGDREEAEALAWRAADAGDSTALMTLARMREEAGDPASALGLARKAAELGNIEAVVEVVRMREEAGDHEGAEALARQATALSKFPHAGEARPLVALVRMREEAGDHEGAEALARQAADTGGAWQFGFEGRWPYGLDPDGRPTPPWSGG
ncbi:hypothetical protein ABT150_34225 [Streptomyces mirabilis]|uniref:tetratricopeptide repeat protein n=1 Tax=Streptomyces mirabilis TaxID=68239 RepID=UPI0033286DCA